jgi:hypothetical protein
LVKIGLPRPSAYIAYKSMDRKDPPLCGSRGTDGLDVVVWFGGTSAGGGSSHSAVTSSFGASASTTHDAVGWPQRILTVGGIQHRTGDDPHSKHVAEARSLVDRFYALEHHQSGAETKEGGIFASSSPIRMSPKGTRAHARGCWTPGPFVKKQKHNNSRPLSACSTINSVIGSDSALPPSAPSGEGHRTTEFPQVIDGSLRRHYLRSYYSPLPLASPTASAGMSLFERRQASASVPPRDSLALQLFREAEERSLTTSGIPQEKTVTVGKGRPPSGKRRGSQQQQKQPFRRPSSAASAASAASGSTNMSLEEARRNSSGRGTAPKNASDFPSADKCRDLNCTIALKRAAAVIERTEREEAERRHALSGADAPHVDDSQQVDEEDTTDVKGTHHRRHHHAPTAAVRPSSATVQALGTSLGQSIMHTVRTTNAQQLLKVKHDMGPSAAEIAKTATSHEQRLAQERLLYKHIPSDVAERMKLRAALEQMQTDFAQREIEANIDDFKRRVTNGTGGKRSLGFGSPGGGTTGSRAGGGVADVGSHGKHKGAALTPSTLHAMLNNQQRDPRKAAAQSQHRRLKAQMENRQEQEQHLQEGRGHRGELSKNSDLHIPVQSRIVIGGKTFMYSELFRPVRTDASAGS